MNKPQLTLQLSDEELSVCRLPPTAEIPAWACEGALTSITRTSEELSIVCRQSAVPEGMKSESGWRALKVDGQLDFGLTGILVAIAGPLAEARISIFAISTFNTDYVLVKEDTLKEAVTVLQNAGHTVQ